MRTRPTVRCESFPCSDVLHEAFIAPSIPADPGAVRMVMISECAPADPADWFFAKGTPLFAATTLQAFADAGTIVGSVAGLRELGVHLTTAVKCAKRSPVISRPTIDACSMLLERELDLFPDVRVIMLMGDAAIAALNSIARRRGLPRVIPAGSTYKLRGGRFSYEGIHVFPSYLQAGPSFFIEKSKRKMIAEDIAAGLRAMA
jgi:uracil-DNA glycosylase